MEGQRKFLVQDKENGLRLDRFLAGQRLPLTRSRIQSLIREGEVLVNGSSSRCSHRIAAGDEVVIVIPDLKPKEIIPEDIPLHIPYEDNELLVVNKPAGMVVHPAAGHYTETLVNALLFYSPHLSTLNGPLRPGIIHRLDKDTSGILVVAKTNEAHLHLARELKEHKLARKYLALVQGEMELEEGSIEAPLGRHILKRKKIVVRHQGGKVAITHYRVLERFRSATLLKVTLATGRTHQIRVHLACIGHPVLGDRTYGRKLSPSGSPRRESLQLSTLIDRQALHAHTLGFIHPSRKEYMEFTAPLPMDMEKLLQRLRK
ncbi:RluA family pseudouridine synthase [candidate division NPL-UPA2 bacterium]|nr:RluA family pseudouridine synthase [candidate division NPL-UPA2 bacterium]